MVGTLQEIIEENFMLGCLLQPDDAMRVLRIIEMKWRFYEHRFASSESDRPDSVAIRGERMGVLSAWGVLLPKIKMAMSVGDDYGFRYGKRLLVIFNDNPVLRKKLLVTQNGAYDRLGWEELADNLYKLSR